MRVCVCCDRTAQGLCGVGGSGARVCVALRARGGCGKWAGPARAAQRSNKDDKMHESDTMTAAGSSNKRKTGGWRWVGSSGRGGGKQAKAVKRGRCAARTLLCHKRGRQENAQGGGSRGNRGRG